MTPDPPLALMDMAYNTVNQLYLNAILEMTKVKTESMSKSYNAIKVEKIDDKLFEIFDIINFLIAKDNFKTNIPFSIDCKQLDKKET